jgi:uncharacterized protein YbjT (DUF2867 family)
MGRAIVFGATRGTGLLLARALIQRDADPVLVARSARKGRSLFGPEANILEADVTRPETLARVFAQQSDALYYTVDITGGVGGRAFFGSPDEIRTVVYHGLANVVDAAKAAKWQGQFILLTTLGLRRRPWLFKSIMALLKPGMFQASIDKANYLMASGSPYTIVQAGALHDGDDSQRELIITGDEVSMTWNTRIARAHLAQVMLACAEEPAVRGQTLSVYGGRRDKFTQANIHPLLRSALSQLKPTHRNSVCLPG